MSVTKRISGSYTIQSVGATDQVYINSSTITVNGNLVVMGNTTTVEASNLVITDNIITLNGNVTGTPTLNSGIQVNRGTSPNVLILWNESITKWQITNDGTTYGNILTSTAAGIANVYADSAPAISANLDLRGHNIWDSTNASNVQLKTGTVSTGGSGVYLTNTAYSQEELALKRRSIAYSIIFG
jgi:hypothetical protein